MPRRSQFTFLKLLATSLAVVPWVIGCGLMHPGKKIMQIAGHPPVLVLQGSIASNANANSPISLDIVILRDKDLNKEISKMDAATWFGAKGRCNYRGGPKAKVQFHSWEFVPGQMFRVDVPVSIDAKAVVGFANYTVPGEHRVFLATSGSQSLQMNEDGVHLLKNAPVANPDLSPAPEKLGVCPDD